MAKATSILHPLLYSYWRDFLEPTVKAMGLSAEEEVSAREYFYRTWAQDEIKIKLLEDTYGIKCLS